LKQLQSVFYTISNNTKKQGFFNGLLLLLIFCPAGCSSWLSLYTGSIVHH